MPLGYPVAGILALPSDKVNALMIQVVIPRIIGITAVEDDNTALGQRQGAAGLTSCTRPSVIVRKLGR